MGLPLFYADEWGSVAPDVGDVVALAGAEGRHAVTVARIGVDERVLIGDGAGAVACCRVVAVGGKDALTGRVEEIRVDPLPRPSVTVVQALPKSERSELAVDLATEAGADEIVAWQSARCVSRWSGQKADRGLAKWRSAARSAAKQSRRSRIPRIEGVATIEDVCSRVRAVVDAGGVVAVLHEEATSSLGSLPLSDAAEVMVVVGPEGGIDDAEIAALVGAGGYSVLLGPQVLRTSTAAAVALGAIGVLTRRWDRL